MLSTNVRKGLCLCCGDCETSSGLPKTITGCVVASEVNCLLQSPNDLLMPHVIMDFRRVTEDNPEDNCDCYNKAHLRAMAHKEKLPVIRIFAEHTDARKRKDGK